MSSEIPKVEMSWQQQLIFGHNTVVTAAQWKAALPHMYIWIDYARCGTTNSHTRNPHANMPISIPSSHFISLRLILSELLIRTSSFTTALTLP